MFESLSTEVYRLAYVHRSLVCACICAQLCLSLLVGELHSGACVSPHAFVQTCLSLLVWELHSVLRVPVLAHMHLCRRVCIYTKDTFTLLGKHLPLRKTAFLPATSSLCTGPRTPALNWAHTPAPAPKHAHTQKMKSALDLSQKQMESFDAMATFREKELQRREVELDEKEVYFCGRVVYLRLHQWEQ